jgi:AcrR family transcriptional regulator
MSSIITNSARSPFSKGYQRQRKFQSILSEAAGLFNWQGSRATTLTDIANSMKLTKTCVYYYVKTKEDLIYQCYVSSCDMWLAQAQQAAALEGNGLEKIVAMVQGHFDQYVKALNGVAPHFAMLAEISSLDEAHAADIKNRWQEVFDLCKKMVSQGIEEGVIENLDPAVICTGIFAIPQWFPVWLKRSHATNPEPIIKAVLDILVNGLSQQHHEFSDIEFPEPSNLSLDSFDRGFQNRLKREAFYRVGTTQFNQKGFKGTSLDEIASLLDVTKGAFYYHIKNKEELLYQCFNRTLTVEKNLLTAAGTVEVTGLKKVELSLRYLFNVQFTDQGPLIRYRSLPSLDEEHRKKILKETKTNSGKLGAYIRQGFDDSTLRKIDADVAQHVLSGAVEASANLAEWVADANVPELSASYFHLFINGLSAK